MNQRFFLSIFVAGQIRSDRSFTVYQTREIDTRVARITEETSITGGRKVRMLS